MNEAQLIEDLRLLAPPAWGWILSLGALVLGGLLLGLWRRRAGSRPNRGTASPGASASPWDQALEELDRLSPLLCPERSREYGMAATAILRAYVEARYALQSPRLTTEEFLVLASTSQTLPATDRQHLGRFLERCDLCKFGRFVAAAGELRELQAAAVSFVLKSRPESPSPTPAENDR